MVEEQPGQSAVGCMGKEGSILLGPKGIVVFHANDEAEFTKWTEMGQPEELELTYKRKYVQAKS